jgi:acyl transferase domain-containing protein
LARLHVTGGDVAWTALFDGAPTPRTVTLPTYAFQSRSYWLREAASTDRTAEAPDDVRFWDAVEQEDTTALVKILDTTAELQPMLAAVLPALASWRRGARP